MSSSKFKTFIFAFITLFIAVSLIKFPEASYEASLSGLTTWWEIVFPSLLPFFIVSELLIGFGVVYLVGTLLEPLMRPLFRVPGTGGFVWAMGMASGYPTGAKLTAKLRQNKELTIVEAERLASFTNFSNPVFIFGTVAAVFFDNESLGILIAVCHYLGNFCVGLIMRFHGGHNEQSVKRQKRRGRLHDAFQMLHRKITEEQRSFGKMLGDAVQSSIRTLLMIGGFIILFSVINKLLGLMHITDVLAHLTGSMLYLFHIPTEFSHALVTGLFEITLGSQLASNSGDSLLYQVMIISFILAFSGFSVQAQVASIFAETDIRFQPFFIGRCLHGLFASFFTFLLWQPLYENESKHSSFDNNGIIPVFMSEFTESWLISGWRFLLEYGWLITLFSLLIYIVVTLRRLGTKKFPG